MSPDARAAIARLRGLLDEAVRPSHLKLATAAVVVSLVGMGFIARAGTDRLRLLGALFLVLTVGVSALLWVRRARALRSPRVVVQRTLGETDPAHAEKTLRALRLVEAPESASVGVSRELINLNLWRLLARTDEDQMLAGLGRRAAWFSGAALAITVGCVGAIALDPIRVVEGWAVLTARDGIAPISLIHVDDVSVLVRPPRYLKQEERTIFAFSVSKQPVGSEIVVRGKATRPDRDLVLTDGLEEVPFTDDGQGDVRATWVLREPSRLFVAARFGDVLIPQADALMLGTIPDLPPTVEVADTPRTLRLLEADGVELVYEARDDHGLEEVALVLRSGIREERRTLSRPLSDSRFEQGGHEISFRDAFFKRAHVPVEITIEARDNDEVTGPKWGVSEPVVVIPPQIGEQEALRLAALMQIRDALTDLLAARMNREIPPIASIDAYRQAERDEQDAVRELAMSVLSDNYGGLALRGPIKKLALGQARRLDESLEAALAVPSLARHAELVATTEKVLLAVDAGVTALGSRDARDVATRLADVADEAAEGARLRARGETERGDALAAAAKEVLTGGASQLKRLGFLGMDLGEIVDNGIRRIERAEAAEDDFHAELAARDLAARLRKPDPSFGGGGGGVESGGMPQPGEGDASEADEEAREIARQLEQLVREHAGEMEDVADALRDATSDEELSSLRDQAKERADAIREAVENLPRDAAPGSPAQSAANEARRAAESMAEALEAGDPDRAVAAGELAMDALERAQRSGRSSVDHFEQVAADESGQAESEIREQLDWARDALKQMAEAASGKARESLEQSADDEGSLAERADSIRQRGESDDSAMPGEMLQLLEEASQAMRQAERALREGKGAEGLVKQREAQRLLEMALGDSDRPPEEPEDGSEESEEGKDGDGDSMDQETEVPGEDDHKGPEAFRKRVMDGLGKPGDPRLQEAVRRYAEGLLK